jgi:hypothetical protein
MSLKPFVIGLGVFLIGAGWTVAGVYDTLGADKKAPSLLAAGLCVALGAAFMIGGLFMRRAISK